MDPPEDERCQNASTQPPASAENDGKLLTAGMLTEPFWGKARVNRGSSNRQCSRFRAVVVCCRDSTKYLPTFYWRHLSMVTF